MTAAMRPGDDAKARASEAGSSVIVPGSISTRSGQRARKLDRRHRRHRRVRDGRDVIVGAEPERLERQHERVGAARDADRVRGAEI